MDAELANAINQVIARQARKYWVKGTVASIQDAHTCTVTLPDGTAVTGVHWLTRGDSWTPPVGSVVFMEGGGRQLLILGNVS